MLRNTSTAHRHGESYRTCSPSQRRSSRWRARPIDGIILVAISLFSVSTSHAQFPARIGPFEALVSLQEGQSASIGEPVIRMDAQGQAILSWGEAPINEYGSPSLHPHLFYRRTGDAGARGRLLSPSTMIVQALDSPLSRQPLKQTARVAGRPFGYPIIG